jgi:hypothetical protein
MREILANTISDVYFDAFKSGVPTDATGDVLVSVYKNGIKLVDSAVATKTTGKVGKYSYTLPVSVTADSVVTGVVTEEAELEIDWKLTISGSTLTIRDYYTVVTPYSPWSYFNDAGKSYADYLECERVSRFIINSYCGQEFGKKTTTFAVEGTGGDSLRLPWRLMTLTDVKYLKRTLTTRPGPIIGLGYPTWEIGSGGWMLRQQPNRVGIDPVLNGGPFFRRNMLYNIAGVWGYNAPPTAIEEASKILTADLMCQDHKYRDKYLQSIKMGDWRIQFHDLAFNGTGNATADKLLLDYRIYPGVGII